MWTDIVISILFGILAVLLLAVLEGITLLAYFKLRQKHPERKFMNEIIIMGGTVAISFIARFIVAILYVQQDQGGFDSVWDGISSGLFALYALIGGLTFEGTYAPNDFLGMIDVGAQILYYGAVAYAGVSTLLILSTCVSYEVYSFFKVGAFLRKFDTVYIFPDVTEEALIMAADIEKVEKSRGLRSSYAILFMGNELEAFDHKNELHREIMDRGYIYWSYAKVADKERELSLLKKLHYTKKGCQKRDKGFNHNKMVHIFSLLNDANMYAAENHNSNFVFDDIQALLKDYCKGMSKFSKCKDEVDPIPTVVNYYLLTHGDINYEFYNTRISTIIDEFFKQNYIENTQIVDKYGKSISKKQMVMRSLQLHILSEAKLTADDLVTSWQSTFMKKWDETCHNSYRKSTLPGAENVYRTAIFGFGKTGQYALKSIFAATSNVTKVDGRYVSSQFIADVYDIDADKRSGEFAYAHPLFLCKTDTVDHMPVCNADLIAWGKDASNDALKYIYDRAKVSPLQMTRDQVWDDMAFPIVDYHRVSCLRQDFMNKIDKSLGIFDKDSVHYNSFVVSMGNDEDNLVMANILIDDFKHEILLTGKSHGALDDEIITIFVHIRDEKNIHRLNWSCDDEKFFANHFRVVSFGCRENIWSYGNIIDDESASMYNYMYNVKSHAMEVERSGQGQLSATEQQIIDSIARDDGAWYQSAIDDIKRKDMWLEVSPFARESNRSAYSFAINYAFVDELAESEYCERVEHLRWNRFHMANGWVYAEYGKTEKAFRRHNKQHTCICPYDMLDKWTQAYDLVNVHVGQVLHGINYMVERAEGMSRSND